MEDAHIADISLADGSDLCMFGVFDGHGGRSGITVSMLKVCKRLKWGLSNLYAGMKISLGP